MEISTFYSIKNSAKIHTNSLETKRITNILSGIYYFIQPAYPPPGPADSGFPATGHDKVCNIRCSARHFHSQATSESSPDI